MTNSMLSIEGSRQSYSQLSDSASSNTKVTLVPYQRRKEYSSILPPSPADSMMVDSHHLDGPLDAMSAEEERLTRKINRGTPGDAGPLSPTKTPEQLELARAKSQFYGDAFAWREPNGSARERVLRESVVMADVRTNVIIQDEYTFITDLSHSLSSRYQRPESSILVSVAHSACLLFGGSFEPAYILTISALPSQLQTTTNKRNSSLLAKILEEALGVPASRGIIKFVPIPEENFASNGRTVAGEIEELEKELGEDNPGLGRSASRMSKAAKRQSMRSLRSVKTTKGGNNGYNDKQPLSPRSERFGSITPPGSVSEDPRHPPLPPIPTEKSSKDKRADSVRKLGKRKSFIQSLFNR